MRALLFLVMLTSNTLLFSQNKFVINENGLIPEFSRSKINNLTKAELYQKTLDWIKTSNNKPDEARDTQIENVSVNFSGTKENALKVGKLYYHLKYTIKISFEQGHYKFEPLEVSSKLNSKYDMGWENFDLKNGNQYFKNGKVIKKTRSYVIDLPEIFNELNNGLKTYLLSN